MVEHATTCPIAQGTGTDCRCRGVVDAHEGYATAAPLPAGRELDALVAERVMHNSHWIREAPDPTCATDGACDGFGPNGQCSACTGIIAVAAPHYSTDIAAAWSVAQHLEKTRGLSCVIATNACANGYQNGVKFFEGYKSLGHEIFDASEHDGWFFVGDSVPVAICRAALAAVAATPPRRAPGGGV